MDFREKILHVAKAILICIGISTTFHILNAIISMMTIFVFSDINNLFPGLKNPRILYLRSFMSNNIQYIIAVLVTISLYILLNSYMKKHTTINKVLYLQIIIGIFTICDGSIKLWQIFRDINNKINSIVSVGIKYKDYFGLLNSENIVQRLFINGIKFSIPNFIIILFELILGIYIIIKSKKSRNYVKSINVE